MNCAVQVQFCHPDAQMPVKANHTDIGYDLHCVKDGDFWFHRSEQKWCYELLPGNSHVFHTGLSIAVEEGYGCLLWDRSGMGAKRQLHRLAGVIDSGYRGEWMVALTNLGRRPQIIFEGDRIIQAVFTPQVVAHMQEVEVLPASVRGDAGFGSTGN